MDYQSAKVAALMAGLEAKVTSIENDQEYRVDSSNDGYSNNKQEHLPNTLNLHGNQATANINPMILTNIQGSPYFKKDLYALKTFHEVVDEIYYKVGFFWYGFFAVESINNIREKNNKREMN